jgi:hypothetical protein
VVDGDGFHLRGREATKYLCTIMEMDPPVAISSYSGQKKVNAIQNSLRGWHFLKIFVTTANARNIASTKLKILCLAHFCNTCVSHPSAVEHFNRSCCDDVAGGQYCNIDGGYGVRMLSFSLSVVTNFHARTASIASCDTLCKDCEATATP